MPRDRSRRVKHRNQIPNAIRAKIIDAVMNQGATFAETARQFGYPPSTIYSIVKKYESNGVVENERKPPPPPRHRSRTIITPEMEEFVLKSYDDDADMTLESLQEVVRNEFDKEIPVSTLGQFLNIAIQYRLKLLRYGPERVNHPETIQKRQQWCQEFDSKWIMNCVYVEASGFNLHHTRRIGQTRTPSTHHNPNLTLCTAISTEGLLTFRIYRQGRFTTDHLKTFLHEDLCPAMTRHGMQNKSIIVNHTPTQENPWPETDGHNIHVLPPYSPLLDMATCFFSVVKPYIKKQDLRNGTLDEYICRGGGGGSITVEQAVGWMGEVQRNFLLAVEGRPIEMTCHTSNCVDAG
ncbi:hypothetical protein DFS34DRAFT_658204 [Phlyctochytrium arcticum]|nr:hypothetical protein DFS34DRAFT_658204 [Phlyctochytrium arcticum]